MSSMSAGVICLLIFSLLCKKSSIEFVSLASSGKPVEAPIELLSGQILCVQHDLKRVNSRARSFKIFCVSVCVTPSRNAKEQQGGDSNGGPKSGLTERVHAVSPMATSGRDTQPTAFTRP